MSLTVLDLAEVHLDLLYETDERGLILRSRDPDVRSPLLHLVRTVEGNLWRLSTGLTGEKHAHIKSILRAEPVLDDLNAMETRAPALEARLIGAIDQSELRDGRGPVFAFPDTPDRATSRDAAILADSRSARVVPELSWLRGAGRQARPICVARNEVGEIVAVCHSARSTAGAAEAGVETASEYRGRGLAAAVVRRWAHEVLTEGRVPVYSTQWSNLASRAVARRLGLVTIGEDCSYG